jgi:type VI protein secretion system component VasK
MLKALWRPTHPAHTTLGLILWSLWFVVLYGGLSVACELAPPTLERGAVNWLNASLLSLTLATTGVLLCLAQRCWRAAKRFEGSSQERLIAHVGAGAHGFSAGATLIVGLPVTALPPCL